MMEESETLKTAMLEETESATQEEPKAAETQHERLVLQTLHQNSLAALTDNKAPLETLVSVRSKIDEIEIPENHAGNAQINLENLPDAQPWDHPARSPSLEAPQAARPIATPLRATLGDLVGEEPQDAEIPDVGDKSVPQPVPGAIRISEQAMQARMRRLMQPSINGTFKVSEEIVKKWKSRGKARTSLESLFQSVGFNKDMGWVSCGCDSR